MRGLRTVGSALCIVAGVALLLAWAVSAMAVRAVEDGAAVEAAVDRAMNSPAVLSGISTRVQDSVVEGLDERGVDAGALGIEPIVRAAVDRSVHSEAFREAVVAQAGEAHAQVASQLTDPDRAPAPLAVSVDVSGLLQQGLGDALPGAGDLAQLDVPPVEVEAMSADAFERTRDSYAAIENLQRWAGWAGLALLMLGVLLSHRRRWFLAKAAFALAALSLAMWAAITIAGPESVVGWLPGAGDDASEGWRGLAAEMLSDSVADRAALIGLIALGCGIVLALIARRTAPARG